MKRLKASGLGAVVAAVVLWVAAPAQSQVRSGEVEAAQRSVRTYFDGEKRGASGFMAVGGVSVAMGGAFALTDNEALRAAAIPTLALGGVDLLIGVLVYAIADGRAERLSAQAAEDLSGFKADEIERIGRLDTTFYWLYAIETAVFIGALGAAGFGLLKDDDTALGVGLGLAVQAPALLILDGFADHRGEVYIQALEGLKADEVSLEQAPGAWVGGLVGVRGVF